MSAIGQADGVRLPLSKCAEVNAKSEQGHTASERQELMLKNTKIGKHIIPKFLLGITLSVLTILILRSGFVGTTSSASASGAGSRPSSRLAQGCDMEPTGVETRDYWIHYKVPPGRMPDPQFDGKPAKLEVHRVRPVYAHGKCQGVPNRAIVLIHGRTNPGAVSFDTRHPTAEDPEGGKISMQEALARAGIDTFAPSLLGYGRSTRFDNGLNDPCNASLPPYNADGSCSFAEGCDRSSNPGIFPLNQQTSSLGVNPLAGQRCAHSSVYRFARIDVWADDVIRVIDDVIERAQPDNNKVVLVGNSLGGVSVARALYNLGNQAENKVQRVVFLSSFFDRLAGAQPGVEIPVNLPTEEENLPPAALSTSFPLALFGLPGGGTPLEGGSACAGRTIPGLADNVREQLIQSDVLGRNWGGNDPTNPTGLLRAPTFSNYGWNPGVAATFTIPTLVLHGFLDDQFPLSNSDHIYDSLTSVTNKALVQLQCASHPMMWEGCSGARCDDGDPNTTPYGGNSQVWAGPYSTVAAALIEWVKHGTFNGAGSGRFVINESGVVSN
jgi:pimeloyl-ACP methyl ester carboxylesterase